MEHKEKATPQSLPAAVSRRNFLKTSTVLATLSSTASTQGQNTGQIIAYVGAYTDKGKGIHMFYLNPADGTLTPWKILAGLQNPSSLAFHPNKKYLYAANEISKFNGSNTGSVTAISVNGATGDLRIL